VSSPEKRKTHKVTQKKVGQIRMEAKIGMMLPEDRKGFCPKDFGESVDF
jgi:hypothetical protein